jgi:hypothetical protein
MLKKKITIGLLAIFTSFLFLGLVNTPVAHAAGDNECLSNADICFIPNVTIPYLTSLPGIEKCSETRQVLNKDGVIVSDTKAGFKIDNCSIANYVKGLYNYVAGIAGIVAMFMIVFAAWQWIMAAGNAGKIDTAKDTIRGALIGLALIFGGYLLMNSISERLVSFDSLQIARIEPNTFSGVCSDLDRGGCVNQPFCVWSEGNKITGTPAACINEAVCKISIADAYEYKDNPRLKCCSHDVLGGDWRYSLAGSVVETCQKICGDGYDDAQPQICRRQECSLVGRDEDECKTYVGLCRWIQQGENRCMEEDGSTVNDMNCNENSDCDIYDPDYCCSHEFGANECRLRDAEGTDCY